MRNSFELKKRYAFLCVLLILCAVYFCNNDNKTEIKPKNNPDNSIEYIQPYDGTGNGNDTGFYYCDTQENGIQNIKYIDYSTKNEIYLCNRLECEHVDDSCPSFVNNPGGTVSIYPQDDNVILIYSGSPANIDYYSHFKEAALPRIYKMDLNGENRVCLFTFSEKEQLVGRVCFSDRYLYLIKRLFYEEKGEIKNRYSLLCIDMIENRIESDEILNFSNPSICGADDEVIYLQGISTENKDLRSVCIDIYSFMPGDKLIKKLYNFQVQEKVYKIIDNNIYILNKTNNSIERLSLENGEIKIMKKDVNIGSTLGGISEVTESGFIFFYYFENDIANVKYSYYDILTNDCYDIRLPITIDGEVELSLIEITDEIDNYYLIPYQKQFVSKGYYDYDGKVVTLIDESNTYALISKQDYIDSIANYIPIKKE